MVWMTVHKLADWMVGRLVCWKGSLKGGWKASKVAAYSVCRWETRLAHLLDHDLVETKGT